MARWLVHPVLRILIPVLLITWFAVLVDEDLNFNHGILTNTVSSRIAGKATYNWSSYGGALFFVDADGVLDVKSDFRPTSQFGSKFYIAYVSHTTHGDGAYGLIYSPLQRRASNTQIVWNTKSLYDFNTNDLDATIATYVDIWRNPSATSEERAKLKMSGLANSNILNTGHPLSTSSKPTWSLIPLLLIYELTYYAVFIWWLITLIYARKVWPKPDSTRCPKCSYSTAGLTTQICPECGTALPSPREA